MKTFETYFGYRDYVSPMLDEDDYNARVNKLRDEYARMYKGDFEPYTVEEVREYLGLNYEKREVIA